MLCESRIKNIIRDYRTRQKHSLTIDDFEDLEKNLVFQIEDHMTENIYTKMIIEETMLSLKDLLEIKYLRIFAGNLGIKGYEESAIQKSSKDVSDDTSVALELGFDNAKRSKYCKVKRNVKKHIAEVMIKMKDVA